MGGIIHGDVYGAGIIDDVDNWGAIPAPNVFPNRENTHIHGLDIKPRVNEAHEDELEARLNELRNEASGIQKEAPKLQIEDLHFREMEPPEDEPVELVFTFENIPLSVIATQHLQTQLEILGAC